MKIRKSGDSDEKIEIQMTSMIDIVFQLLVFFIMTFKIVTMEGDFNIKMPLEGPSAGSMELEPPTPPIAIRLVARSNGELSGIQMKIGQAAYTNVSVEDPDPNDPENTRRLEALRNRIIEHVGSERGPDSTASETELELECDYHLNYKEVVAVITAVSGFPDDDGQLVSLIQNIKFKPQPEESTDS